MKTVKNILRKFKAKIPKNVEKVEPWFPIKIGDTYKKECLTL